MPAFLSADRWRQMLECAGFRDCGSLADSDEGQPAQRTIFLARGAEPARATPDLGRPAPPWTEAASWLILVIAPVWGNTRRTSRQLGEICIVVSPGDAYARRGETDYTVRPACPRDMVRLLKE